MTAQKPIEVGVAFQVLTKYDTDAYLLRHLSKGRVPFRHAEGKWDLPFGKDFTTADFPRFNDGFMTRRDTWLAEHERTIGLEARMNAEHLGTYFTFDLDKNDSSAPPRATARVYFTGEVYRFGEELFDRGYQWYSSAEIAELQREGVLRRDVIVKVVNDLQAERAALAEGKTVRRPRFEYVEISPKLQGVLVPVWNYNG